MLIQQPGTVKSHHFKCTNSVCFMMEHFVLMSLSSDPLDLIDHEEIFTAIQAGKSEILQKNVHEHFQCSKFWSLHAVPSMYDVR